MLVMILRLHQNDLMIVNHIMMILILHQKFKTNLDIWMQTLFVLSSYGFNHVRFPGTYEILVNCPFPDVLCITIDVNALAPSEVLFSYTKPGPVCRGAR